MFSMSRLIGVLLAPICSLFVLGQAVAATELLTAPYDLSIDAISPTNTNGKPSLGTRFELAETVAGSVFGPGKTGTIVFQFANHGQFAGYGYSSNGCWGTLSVGTITPNQLQVTITAAPATAPTTPCRFSLLPTLWSLNGPSVGDVKVSVVGGTLLGLTTGIETTIARWAHGAVYASLRAGTQPTSGHAGNVIALPDIDLTETAIYSLYANFDPDAVSLQLPSGYTWEASGSAADPDESSVANPPAIDPTNSARLYVDYVRPSTFGHYRLLRLSGLSIRAPANAVPGSISVAISMPVSGLAEPVVSNVQVATLVASPGTLAFSKAATRVREKAGFVTLTVTRTGGTLGAATVHYATADGTATAGEDYTAVTAGLLSWDDGESVGKSILIPIIDDAIKEGKESFTVTLYSPTGATLGATNTATVTITDQAVLPVGVLMLLLE